MSSEKKSDLGPRLVTAAVALPILLGIILLSPAWGFFALIAGAGAISAWEYATITNGDGPAQAPWLVAALTLVTMSVMYFAPTHGMEAMAGSAIALFIFYLFKYGEQSHAAARMGSAITAVIHGGLLLVFLAKTREVAAGAGPLWIIIILGATWGSDAGAYFAGKKFGRRKLYPAVSPNKTIEGALGSVASGFLLTVAFGLLFTLIGDGVSWEIAGQKLQLTWKPMQWWHFFVLAIPANVLGQLGDLAESLIKRAHGVKDSGTIIYGHGGMLDRIDALIFVSPWYFMFVAYIL